MTPIAIPRPGPGVAAVLLLLLHSFSAPADSFSYHVLGDTRSNADILEGNIRTLTELDPSAIAVFNLGDITSDGKASQWDEHHQALRNGSDGLVKTDMTGWGPDMRYVGAIGNHDTHEDNWLEAWNEYLPGQVNLGNNGYDGIYFLLTYQNTAFIILDSENPSDAQTNWLSDVLQLPEVRDATWKFAFFHHPVYPCNRKSPYDEGLEWVELFEEHRLDIAFVAHSHTYERTCPMLRGQCHQGGVIYLNTSGGGAGVREVEESKSETVSHGDRSDDYDCSEILEKSRGDWHHFCHLSIDGPFLDLACYSHEAIGPALDSLSLQKDVVEPDGGQVDPDGGIDFDGQDGDAGSDAGFDANTEDAGNEDAHNADGGLDADAGAVDSGTDVDQEEEPIVIGSCACLANASSPVSCLFVGILLLLLSLAKHRP